MRVTIQNSDKAAILQSGVDLNDMKRVNAESFSAEVNPKAWKQYRLVTYLRSKAALFPDFPEDV